MSYQAFVSQEIVDASTLDTSKVCCPHCAGTTIVLSGMMQVPAIEVMLQGEIVESRANSENGGCFNLDRIDCLNCSRSFWIRDSELFRLERENLELKQLLEELHCKRSVVN